MAPRNSSCYLNFLLSLYVLKKPDWIQLLFLIYYGPLSIRLYISYCVQRNAISEFSSLRLETSITPKDYLSTPSYFKIPLHDLYLIFLQANLRNTARRLLRVCCMTIQFWRLSILRGGPSRTSFTTMRDLPLKFVTLVSGTYRVVSVIYSSDHERYWPYFSLIPSNL